MPSLRRDGFMSASARSFTIVLEESSGPVPPRFFYVTRIRMRTEGGGVTVDYDDDRSGKATHVAGAALSDEATNALWDLLTANGALDSGDDAVAEKKDRVGVSFNYYEIVLNGASARFDDLLSNLKDPQFVAQKTIIEAIKQAAHTVQPVTTTPK